MQLHPEGLIIGVSLLVIFILGQFLGVLPATDWAVNKEMVESDKLPTRKKAEVLRTLRLAYRTRSFFSFLVWGPLIGGALYQLTQSIIPSLGFILGSTMVIIGLLGTAITQFTASKVGVGRYLDDAVLFMRWGEASRYQQAARRVAKRRRQRALRYLRK